jgi:hypothetical protein
MTLEDIREEVEKRGGVYTVTMTLLREAAGYKRLRVNVRGEISWELARLGIAHVPQELPNEHTTLVRLYLRGTPVGELIEEAITPGELHDRAIVARCTQVAPDYARIIAKIRDLVAED